MVQEITEEQYENAWEKFNASPLQSWQWGELKKSTWEIERIGVFDKEKLIGITLILYKRLPLYKIFKFTFAYIPRGFAVESIEKLSFAVSELTKYISQKQWIIVLLDPDNNFLFDNWNSSLQQELKNNQWKVSGITIQPNQTDSIKLATSENALFSQVRPKWRRNIKKAQRQGITIQEKTNSQALQEFYKVITSVSENTTFKAHTLDYFQKMWQLFEPHKKIRIFTATHNETTVASYLILTSSFGAYEIYGGATREGRNREAAYLLKWEIIHQINKEGKKFYDQWGVAPKNSPQHPLSGISYFKSGFGGRYIEFLPQYAYTKNKFIFFLYKFIRRIL